MIRVYLQHLKCENTVERQLQPLAAQSHIVQAKINRVLYKKTPVKCVVT